MIIIVLFSFLCFHNVAICAINHYRTILAYFKIFIIFWSSYVAYKNATTKTLNRFNFITKVLLVVKLFTVLSH